MAFLVPIYLQSHCATGDSNLLRSRLAAGAQSWLGDRAFWDVTVQDKGISSLIYLDKSNSLAQNRAFSFLNKLKGL